MSNTTVPRFATSTAVRLIASEQGRLSETTIRSDVYQITRPCVIWGCAHDRDPDECEAMDYGQESKCPSSRSPHPIRRG